MSLDLYLITYIGALHEIYMFRASAHHQESPKEVISCVGLLLLVLWFCSSVVGCWCVLREVASCVWVV
jgi:hypothetical protein